MKVEQALKATAQKAACTKSGSQHQSSKADNSGALKAAIWHSQHE
jgi:hypothetical protein